MFVRLLHRSTQPISRLLRETIEIDWGKHVRNMQGNILTQPFKPVTLSGELTGVFDTNSGFVRANTSEGNIDTQISDDGSFTLEVPNGDSFNIAYLETNTTGFPPVQRVIECVSHPLRSNFDCFISRLSRRNTVFPSLSRQEGAK